MAGSSDSVNLPTANETDLGIVTMTAIANEIKQPPKKRKNCSYTRAERLRLVGTRLVLAQLPR